MNRGYLSMLSLVAATLTSLSTSSLGGAEPETAARGKSGAASAVQFDLPPIAAAIASDHDPEEVTVELRLSSMIVATPGAHIDQWLLRCQPRDRSLWVADYAPRTETQSDLVSSIQVKNSAENTRGMGMGLDGAYGQLARVNAAVDRSMKQIDSVQFDRVAPLHAVTASGTINRGHGVYFKLRWTRQQVLEGEKQFRVTMKVPANWRGGLMDVSVIAQGEHKSFGRDPETKTIGSASFVVAMYRSGDEIAEASARSLADSEYALRQIAARHRADGSGTYTLTSVLRQVASRLDFHSDDRSDEDWLPRLLTDRADPHLDKAINRLPMPIRLAVLEYADQRDAFLALGRQVSGPQPRPET